MKGPELIALAGIVATQLTECMEHDELHTLTEFLGLLRHNIEIIRRQENHLQKNKRPVIIKA